MAVHPHPAALRTGRPASSLARDRLVHGATASGARLGRPPGQLLEELRRGALGPDRGPRVIRDTADPPDQELLPIDRLTRPELPAAQCADAAMALGRVQQLTVGLAR